MANKTTANAFMASAQKSKREMADIQKEGSGKHETDEVELKKISLLIPAWRGGSRACLTIAVLQLVGILTAIPAFFAPAEVVPAGTVVFASDRQPIGRKIGRVGAQRVVAQQAVRQCDGNMGAGRERHRRRSTPRRSLPCRARRQARRRPGAARPPPATRSPRRTSRWRANG